MLIRNSKDSKSSKQDKRIASVKAESLGSLEHYLAVEGYSAEDLTAKVGDTKRVRRVEESVERAKSQMRPIIQRALRTR